MTKLPGKIEKQQRQLERCAKHAVKRAQQLGAQHCEARAAIGESLSLSVRNSEVDRIEDARSSSLSVRVMLDDRVATSSTNNLDFDAMESFLATALEMAALSEPDPIAVPPDPSELGALRERRDLELFDAHVLGVTVNQGISMAKRAESAALEADKRITASDGGNFSRGWGQSVLATSGGFVGANAATSISFSAHVIADDRDGKKRAGFDYSSGRHVEDLDDPELIGQYAALRAYAQLGSRKVPTGTYPIFFDRHAARGLLGLFASCVLGSAVYRERSYLQHRLTESVASKIVHIIDDPYIVRGMGSRIFDGEGRHCKTRSVVSKGVLQSFLVDTYSARKLGISPTASAGGGGGLPYSTTTNFYMKAGRAAPLSLIRGMERGLVVTRTMGFGFDAVTGNFSRGAQGFYVENGRMLYPVSEITISRNLDEIFRAITAIANDLYFDASITCPSFLVDGMTVSGE